MLYHTHRMSRTILCHTTVCCRARGQLLLHPAEHAGRESHPGGHGEHHPHDGPEALRARRADDPHAAPVRQPGRGVPIGFLVKQLNNGKLS